MLSDDQLLKMRADIQKMADDLWALVRDEPVIINARTIRDVAECAILLLEQYEQLAPVVKGLAETSVYDVWDHERDNCNFCYTKEYALEQHRLDCPWRRARELVGAHE